MAHLQGTAGPMAGKKFRLGRATTLGRSRNVDVRFDDLSVSREHARVVVDTDGEFVIEDLQSGNGTLVNGKRVRSARLHNGDVVAIGAGKLVFQGSARPAAIAAADKIVLEVSGTQIGQPVINEVEVGAPSDPAIDAAAGPAETDRRIRIMCEMLQSVGTDLNEERLLAKILNALFRIFPDTSRGFVILRDPETGALKPSAAKIAGPDADRRVTVSRTLLRHVLQRRTAVLSNDAMQDKRFDDSPSIFKVGVRSLMCAPLVHGDSVLGFIMLDTQEVSDHYNETGLALLAAVAQPAGLAIVNARMHARLVAQERLEQDLRNAARIQRHFLPQELPRVEGYEFADSYRAAHEVGGDFYSYVELSDGRLGIALGDVSGKGITAALMMGKMMEHVRFGAGSADTPGKVLKAINAAVMGSMAESFVTVLFAMLDPEKHRVVLASAGHVPMLVRRGDGTVEAIECDRGFPIGVTMDAEFSERTVDLGPEDRVLALSDGITDAINEQKERYGDERLCELVAGCPLGPTALVERIRESIADHMGAADQVDDMALLCFGRRVVLPS